MKLYFSGLIICYFLHQEKFKFKIMRIFIGCLGMLLLVISCENGESIDSDRIESIKYLKAEKHALDIPTSDFESEKEAFENRMEWIAYMTAQLLLKNNASKQQFIDAMNNSVHTNVVKLEELLSSSVDNQSFISDFETEFNFYQEEEVSRYGCSRPSGRPTPPNPPSVAAADFQPTDFELYVSSLLNDDCLELYMPNGYNDGIASESLVVIKSTAHPLDDYNSNYGYVHVGVCNILEEIIDKFSNGNIIVVRPYRKFNVCTYEEYADVNFRNFLN